MGSISCALSRRRASFTSSLRDSIESELEIAPESLSSGIAEMLIARLNAELSASYPEPGATHFRLEPVDVVPGEGVFVVASFLGAMTDEQLQARSKVRGEDRPLEQTMLHILNHSSYHRGQVVTLLRQTGYAVEPMDFLVYLGETR